MSQENLKCLITKSLGRYNFASTEKEWCVQVLLPDGKWISEHWPENDEPCIEGEPPSEVLRMIVERLNSYWICTRREENLARIDAVRPMFGAMDDAWARQQIESHQRQIELLKNHLQEA
ncbi:hypothetical protein [Burkholderia gladioli]|uniref:hypothetical protein n=1 Tax=Burkholderia gladioli TaxID=28095 RepID=UPI0019055FBC|nr:hypothetical protein [Burkholderia gladioli]MBJ9709848.1 hypothetical protein [Burkholderia gladioli]